MNRLGKIMLTLFVSVVMFSFGGLRSVAGDQACGRIGGFVGSSTESMGAGIGVAVTCSIVVEGNPDKKSFQKTLNMVDGAVDGVTRNADEMAEAVVRNADNIARGITNPQDIRTKIFERIGHIDSNDRFTKPLGITEEQLIDFIEPVVSSRAGQLVEGGNTIITQIGDQVMTIRINYFSAGARSACKSL